jgi:hypothetical protein
LGGAGIDPRLARTPSVGQTRDELRTLVVAFTDLTSRLRAKPVPTRAQIDATLGVRLDCDPTTRATDAEVSPSHEMWARRVSEGETVYTQRLRAVSR